MIRMATDVGGTFTDVVWANDSTGLVRGDKSPTTPSDFVLGVINAISKTGVSPASLDQFVHGSTVATNALIVHGGGKTGLITTRGFRDAIEIRRINRPDDHIYNMFWSKPPALIPRALRLEVNERLRHTGEVIEPLAVDEVEQAIEVFRERDVDSIAVCLLHAYANPKHELAIREIIQERWPQVFISLSHEVAREIREYERVSSTAIDAYVKKPVVSYLRRLQRVFTEDLNVQHDPLIANSTGGVSTVNAISQAPIQMLASGPAGGAIGAAHLSSVTGCQNLVTADVGGTSFDVSIIVDGKNVLRTEHEVLGYIAKVSSIDVRSVGAGGGSIAAIDSGGMLQVGPESAGADPGPMCYSRGGKNPTVTDAAIVSGIIDPSRFADGEMHLDPSLSAKGIATLADQLGLTLDECAEGILTIARNSMADITRQIVVGQGYDPRDFVLLGFGGGGGLFACDVARNLGIPNVMIPNHPAAFSAWGMLNAAIVGSFARSAVLPFASIDHQLVESLFIDMEKEAGQLLSEANIPPDKVRFERSVEARYEGQGHEVGVSMNGLQLDETLPHTLSDRFDERHALRFGHAMDAAREAVTFRLRVYGEIETLSLSELQPADHNETEAILEHRSVRLSGARYRSAVYDRALLRPGHYVSGPAIVEESSHSTVLFPGDELNIDSFGNLHVSIGG